jgi:Leucine-rich repeat (LRR) protein
MELKDLPKDPFFLIILKLNDVDLANFCKVNKYFRKKIYKSNIWNYRLSQLNNEYSEDIQELKTEFNTSKELYQLVKSLILAKEIFKVDWNLTELYNKKIIYLTNKGIKKIPNLSLFKNLEQLELKNDEYEHKDDKNKIEKIPETLPNSLKVLSLGMNKIKEIPETLPDSLEVLDLDFNNIKEIPKKLPKSLEELYLMANKIKEIPFLKSLKILDLDYNDIKELPDNLPDSLEQLSLYGSIIEIPEKYKDIIKN